MSNVVAASAAARRAAGREEQPQAMVARGVVDADREVDARHAGRERAPRSASVTLRHLVGAAVAAGVERAPAAAKMRVTSSPWMPDGWRQRRQVTSIEPGARIVVDGIEVVGVAAVAAVLDGEEAAIRRDRPSERRACRRRPTATRARRSRSTRPSSTSSSAPVPGSAEGGGSRRPARRARRARRRAAAGRAASGRGSGSSDSTTRTGRPSTVERPARSPARPAAVETPAAERQPQRRIGVERHAHDVGARVRRRIEDRRSPAPRSTACGARRRGPARRSRSRAVVCRASSSASCEARRHLMPSPRRSSSRRSSRAPGFAAGAPGDAQRGTLVGRAPRRRPSAAHGSAQPSSRRSQRAVARA